MPDVKGESRCARTIFASGFHERAKIHAADAQSSDAPNAVAKRRAVQRDASGCDVQMTRSPSSIR
jgi:hypothetical protein